MEQDEVKNSKLIYAFMGGKWKAIKDYRGSSYTSNSKKFASELLCQKWCDKQNKIIDSLKRYAGEPKKEKWFPAPTFISTFFGKDFKYYSSWDKLHPVIDAISKMWWSDYEDVSEGTLEIAKQEVTTLLITTPIKKAVKECVKFIKWHNTNNK